MYLLILPWILWAILFFVLLKFVGILWAYAISTVIFYISYIPAGVQYGRQWYERNKKAT